MKNELLDYLKNVAHGARNLLTSILDEDLDWQPSYGGRTTKEIMTHIANLMEGDTKMGNGTFPT
ncbi:MAG: hypothetical protein IH840_11005 [Candidatus Heimdallarchaeota archaeon]|nr:hypothetical protein [Candidatus Heimdallarchaeota archaeon]